MKSGICLKCDSSDVRRASNGIRGQDNWRMFTSLWGKSQAHEAIEVETYLCFNCGYFENYVIDEAKLSKAAQVWG